MELVSVFLADDVGINDRGAMRLDGGYLGWLPVRTQEEVDRDEQDGTATYRIVVVGRGLPRSGADLAVTISGPGPTVAFDAPLDLPAERSWWLALSAPAHALASAPGEWRIDVALRVDGSEAGTEWWEYEVRTQK